MREPDLAAHRAPWVRPVGQAPFDAQIAQRRHGRDSGRLVGSVRVDPPAMAGRAGASIDPMRRPPEPEPTP